MLFFANLKPRLPAIYRQMGDGRVRIPNFPNKFRTLLLIPYSIAENFVVHLLEEDNKSL